MSLTIGAFSRLAGLVAAVTLLGLAPPLMAEPVAPGSAATPSFDCAKAAGAVETAICADPRLAAQDRALAQLYALVRTDALGAGPSGQLTAQRKWLADRDKQCSAKAPTEIAACVRQQTDARLADLAASALIRAPEPALAELRRQFPERAPLYEAILRMTTMPAGAARTDAVTALIGPEFQKVLAAQADMLDKIKTAHDAAATVKSFAFFIDLDGAVADTPVTIPCEAIVRQPAMIGALDSMFGSSMDNALGGSDCDDMLPPPPHFASLAGDALTTAMDNPDCTGTIRFAGMRAYSEFLIAVQLNRQGAQQPPEAGVARRSAAYQRKHAAAVTAAANDLAAFYTAELHLADAAALARRAVGQVVDSAYEVCDM